MQREDGLNVTIRKDHKGHKDSLSWPELAPGAYASEPLDIMSGVDGLVGAETFAAVDPHNNNKLAKDLAKMAARSEHHRYVFFLFPKIPRSEAPARAGERRDPSVVRRCFDTALLNSAVRAKANFTIACESANRSEKLQCLPPLRNNK
jgi:hypothetical protein